VWLRPVKRWLIAAAATLAAATVTIPVTVVSMATLAALASNGDAGAIIGAAVATALGGLAYTALFVLVGLVVKRALVYVFIWEFFVARAGAGAARLSINSYASSLLADFSGIEIRLADRGTVTSYIVLAAVSAVAVALTTWRLNNSNVA
jgi:ABC-2 type transport system permease protein